MLTQMKTLIVGIGALGGLIGARLLAAGLPVSLAARHEQSAAQLRESGLRIADLNSSVTIPDIRPFAEFRGDGRFDLVILATKAAEAIDLAPEIVELLSPGGVIVPFQNGSVFHVLGDLVGTPRVIGCLSNIGATMHAPGIYEQRNGGNLLIGEVHGKASDRITEIRDWLGQGIDVRTTENFLGASWSKLLLNCSITTIGAISGSTMRQYIGTDEGLATFIGTYDEALNVAMAHGIQPEPMLVSPIPPGWSGKSQPNPDYNRWLAQLVESYGDLKPSMLQDFERHRKTEIRFINGYVADLGRKLGIPTPFNDAIVGIVSSIEAGRLEPLPGNLRHFSELFPRTFP